MTKGKRFVLISRSVDENGKRAPCAFFMTAMGCRNGDQCKFAHEGKQKPIKRDERECRRRSGSVVSSESSGDDDDDDDDRIQQQESKKRKSPAPPPAEGGSKKKTKKSKKKRSQDHPESPEEAEHNNEPKASFDTQDYGRRRDDHGLQQLAPLREFSVLGDPTSSTSAPTVLYASTRTPATTAAALPPLPAPAQPEARSPPTSSPTPAFRKLDLPVASFATKVKREEEEKKEEEVSPALRQQTLPDRCLPRQSEVSPALQQQTLPARCLPRQSEGNKYVFPTSTLMGRKWRAAVEATQNHRNFARDFDFDAMQEKEPQHTPWITAKPFDAAQHASLPQAICVDCEMCETRDPVSGERDQTTLCRVSVIDAETKEVLLDTLVKPAWPVTDLRTRIHGIAEKDLKHVEFTLRHAQAFFMALCSSETVIMGHSLQNDLKALRMKHTCVADSACLYQCQDDETKTCSLRDLAATVLKESMPTKHDSVNDAHVTLACLKHYRDMDGDVPTIKRRPSNKAAHSDKGSAAEHYGSQLFLHSIPEAATVKHIERMFLDFATIKPVKIEPIENKKTHVFFRTAQHCELAFDSLTGPVTRDATGRDQKTAILKKLNSCLRVRKMRFSTPSKDP